MDLENTAAGLARKKGMSIIRLLNTLREQIAAGQPITNDDARFLLSIIDEEIAAEKQRLEQRLDHSWTS